MDHSQRSLRTIAYLGPAGSFTHQATSQKFSDAQDSLVPQKAIADVFEAVSSGLVSYGVVPLENSTNGSVVFTLDLLVDRPARLTRVKICDEIYLAVHHNLVGRRRQQKRVATTASCTHESETRPESESGSKPDPGPKSESESESNPDFTAFTTIRHVYSHPQVWGQCEAFLSRYLPHATRHDVSSTAEAARQVAILTDIRDERVDDKEASDSFEGDDRTQNDAASKENGVRGDGARGECAAIASHAVGTRLGLDFFAREIEDAKDNTTRFLVLTTEAQTSTTGHGGGDGNGGVDETRSVAHGWKSLLRYSPPANGASALAALVTKIGDGLVNVHTRPSGQKPWHNVFLIEVARRWRGQEDLDRLWKDDGSDDELSSAVQWLGSWQVAR